MLHFQERFFQTLDTPLNIKCTCRVHFTEDGGFDRVISATETKLIWPDAVGQEICMREIFLPYNNVDFVVSGLCNILVQQQNYLYLTLVPRQNEKGDKCHMLCFALNCSSWSDSGSVEGIEKEDDLVRSLSLSLTLQQDLACRYCPLDTQNLLYDPDISVLLVTGSDRRMHLYSVDPASGRLQRSLRHCHSHKRRHRQARDWAQRLSSAICEEGEGSAPLCLLCEQWQGEVCSGEVRDDDEGDGELLRGLQGLVGHVDGRLYWSRKRHRRLTPDSSAACSGSSEIVEGGVDCVINGDVLGLQEEEASEEETESVGAVACTRIEQVAHHQVRSVPGDFGLCSSGLSVVAEEEEEEEEEEEREDDKEEEKENEDSPVPSQCSSVLFSEAVTELKQALTAQPLFLSSEVQHCSADEDATRALLLDGGVSCLQFYHWESEASRRFRGSHRSASACGDNSGSVSGTYSPAVLVGLSEGSVALLSLEGKRDDVCGADTQLQVKSLLLPPQLPSTQDTSTDDPSDLLAGRRSISQSEGVVRALCVADVTGDGHEDILVGSHDGSLRVASLVQKRAGSENTDATANWEGWSADSTEFFALSQLQLPYPIVSVHFGPLLGNVWTSFSAGVEGGSSTMNEYMSVAHSQLVVHTTQSVHVYSVQRSAEEQILLHRKEALVKSILHSLAALHSPKS